MRAEGRDRRGQGGAKATIVSSMREDGDTTHVEVVTDFTITGRLARFGRGGMIEDVSNRLLSEFSDCLEQRLSRRRRRGGRARGAEPAAAEPVADQRQRQRHGEGAAARRVRAAAAVGAAPPPPAPEPEPFDAGGAVGSMVQERVKQAAPLLLVALVLGWLIGRRR